MGPLGSDGIAVVAILIIAAVVLLVWRAQRAKDTTVRVTGPARLVPALGSPVDPVPLRSIHAAEIPALLQQRFDPNLAAAVDAVIQLRFTDADPSTWHLTIRDRTCAAGPGEVANPTLTITTPVSPWRDVLGGSASIAGAYIAGRFQADGDMSLLMRLDTILSAQPVGTPIFPSPTPESPRPRRDPSPEAEPASLRDRIALLGAASLAAALERNAISALSPEDKRELVQQIRDASQHGTPEERRRVILDLLSQHLGEAETMNTEEVPVTIRAVTLNLGSGAAHLGISADQIQEAVRAALASLPPNASQEERATTLRAALSHLSGHLHPNWEERTGGPPTAG